MIVGVDYSSYEAALVALPLDGSIAKVQKATATFRPARASGEDAALEALGEVRPRMLDALIRLGVVLYDQSTEPSVIWIERGFGASRRADFILGAFFGAIFAACRDFGLIVNPLEAREWKREITAAAGIGMVKDGTRGNPNAKKEIANEACRGLLVLGEVDGADWTPDELDAFGVCWTGRQLNERALAALEK